MHIYLYSHKIIYKYCLNKISNFSRVKSKSFEGKYILEAQTFLTSQCAHLFVSVYQSISKYLFISKSVCPSLIEVAEILNQVVAPFSPLK